MCLSPHEMTVTQIERIIANYRNHLDSLEEQVAKTSPDDSTRIAELERSVRYYARQLENYEALLKERAEEGRMVEAEG